MQSAYGSQPTPDNLEASSLDANQRKTQGQQQARPPATAELTPAQAGVIPASVLQLTDTQCNDMSMPGTGAKAAQESMPKAGISTLQSPAADIPAGLQSLLLYTTPESSLRLAPALTAGSGDNAHMAADHEVDELVQTIPQAAVADTASEVPMLAASEGDKDVETATMLDASLAGTDLVTVAPPAVLLTASTSTDSQTAVAPLAAEEKPSREGLSAVPDAAAATEIQSETAHPVVMRTISTVGPVPEKPASAASDRAPASETLPEASDPSSEPEPPGTEAAALTLQELEAAFGPVTEAQHDTAAAAASASALEAGQVPLTLDDHQATAVTDLASAAAIVDGLRGQTAAEGAASTPEQSKSSDAAAFIV